MEFLYTIAAFLFFFNINCFAQAEKNFGQIILIGREPKTYGQV
jgi:hypothetical protein